MSKKPNFETNLTVTSLNGHNLDPRQQNSVGLINIGELYLVLPVLNLSILYAGILIMVQQVRLMIFSLIIVDCPVPHILPQPCCRPGICLGGQVDRTILKCLYSLSFLWDTSFMLKSLGVVGGGWVASRI